MNWKLQLYRTDPPEIMRRRVSDKGDTMPVVKTPVIKINCLQ